MVFSSPNGGYGNIFPVSCAGVDDSVAINAALDLSLASIAAGKPSGIYIPGGICVYKTFHATMLAPVSIYGDGNMHSIIKVDPTNAGDVFSWKLEWQGVSFSPTADTIGNLYVVGVQVKGVTVVGQRSASGVQNAFAFYDPNDFVYFNDVGVYYMKGSCLRAGFIKSAAVAYLRESEFYSLRCFMDGDTNNAVIDLDSAGGGDGTNQVNFYDTNVFAFFGPGVRLRSSGAGAGTRGINFFRLRVEQNGSIAQNFDAFVIGDAVEAGGINSIDCYSCTFTQASATANAVHTLAFSQAAGVNQYGINFYSSVASNSTGDAINITSGRAMRLGFWNIVTTTGGKKDIIVGPTTGGTSGPIVVDSQGLGSTWDVTIDASMAASVTQVNSLAVFP